MPETENTGWRVAWGPGPDDEADQWLVVFRMDDLERDAEGPQIVVVSAARTDYDTYDPETCSHFDEEHSYSTRFHLQVRGRDGSVAAEFESDAPYGFGYAIDAEDALEHAQRVVEQFAGEPDRWEWDGAAESGQILPPMPDWLDVPADAVVSLRRQSHSRAREQWAIVPADHGLLVKRGSPQHGSWHTSAGPFSTVTDALAATPEMTTVGKDEISLYQLDGNGALSTHGLAAVLDLSPSEGDSTPYEWDAADLRACGWDHADWPFGTGRWVDNLPVVSRLAAIDGTLIAGVRESGRCYPILLGTDGPAGIEVIASAVMRTRAGLSMVGYYRSYELLLAAPGLAVGRQEGDELFSGQDGLSFSCAFPQSGDPQEKAEAIAEWLTDIQFDFWAALILEPFDPAGQLTDEEEREAWEEFEEHTITMDPWLDIPDDTRDALRRALARRSASYRQAAEARANPRGHAAQVMLASIQPDLEDGSWASAN